MELKQRLTNALVLTVLNSHEPYMVYTNGLCTRLGYVLMKNDKVVDYASHELKTHEKNYPTHDLELTMVIFSFKI